MVTHHQVHEFPGLLNADSDARFDANSSHDMQVILVVNKVDILETPAEKAAVLDFVAQNGSAVLGSSSGVDNTTTTAATTGNSRVSAQGVPQLFAVSARLALKAKIAATEHAQ